MRASSNSDMEKIRQKYAKRKHTRAKDIKLYCKEQCCAGDNESWKNCTFDNCILWRWRMGRELLGNRTSFSKTRAKPPIIEQKPVSGEVSHG